MSLKNIKVTDEVKQQLDKYALDRETYNVTIQRLLLENMRLKEDKRILTRILLLNAPSDFKERCVPFIESVMFDSPFDRREKFDTLVRYFSNVKDIGQEELLYCIQIVIETHDISSGALIDFKEYVEEGNLMP